MRTNLPAQPAGLLGASEYALQESINAFSEELYTNAKKLVNTGIAGADAEINTSGETFIGQLRWKKPLDAKINVISLTDASEGEKTVMSTDYAKYVKTARSHGARQVNMAQIVTQEDGLQKIASDFAETRMQDEHNALFAVLRGVMISEALIGTRGSGGQGYDNDPKSATHGFYVDLGATKLIADASAIKQGAIRAEGFLDALGMGFKDYEPEYAYLTVTPRLLASFRSANLVDQDRVTEGNLEFQTILGGKFRLINTRQSFNFSTVELDNLNSTNVSTTNSGVDSNAGPDIIGTQCAMIILPNAISFNQIQVPMPVELERNAASFNGGGTTDLWYRWGYVAHPRGYSWAGSEDKFVADADFQKVGTAAEQLAGNGISLNAGASVLGATTKGAFVRKAQSVLSLSILPVFHS